VLNNFARVQIRASQCSTDFALMQDSVTFHFDFIPSKFCTIASCLTPFPTSFAIVSAFPLWPCSTCSALGVMKAALVRNLGDFNVELQSIYFSRILAYHAEKFTTGCEPRGSLYSSRSGQPKYGLDSNRHNEDGYSDPDPDTVIKFHQDLPLPSALVQKQFGYEQ
jgi:hypothetical protein